MTVQRLMVWLLGALVMVAACTPTAGTQPPKQGSDIVIGIPLWKTTRADGILTAGGSEANLTALVAARERLDYTDRQRAILYVAQQRHWSVDRAAKIAGLAGKLSRLLENPENVKLIERLSFGFPICEGVPILGAEWETGPSGAPMYSPDDPLRRHREPSAAIP